MGWWQRGRCKHGNGFPKQTIKDNSCWTVCISMCYSSRMSAFTSVTGSLLPSTQWVVPTPWESEALVGLTMWNNLIAYLFIWPRLHVHNITQPGRGFSCLAQISLFKRGLLLFMSLGCFVHRDPLFTPRTTTGQICETRLACCCP